MLNGKDDGISDAQLLKRIGRTDHHAFRILIDRYSRLCYRLAYRFLRDKGKAEDISQDIMLKLWRQPGLWNENTGAKFSTWLYRVTTNAAIDSYRKHKKELQFDDDVWEKFEDGAKSPQENADAQKLLAQLHKAINGLPQKQNTALVLCRLNGMTHKEVADIMGVSPKAVERSIDRGIKSLQQQFKYLLKTSGEKHGEKPDLDIAAVLTI